MERSRKVLSIADVAVWGSALTTFGLAQGALYLKAYWGSFGLDPFQFVAVSELALAGLAAVGFVLGLMLLAALLGGWVEGQITNISPERRTLRWLVPIAFFVTIGMVVWLTNSWVILAGAIFTVFCVLAVTLSPVVPPSVKSSPWLIYIVLMLVYVSIAMGYLGAESAQKIIRGDGKYVSTVSLEGETLSNLIFLGRLGDTYALWEPATKATVLLQASDIKKLKTMRKNSLVPNRAK